MFHAPVNKPFGFLMLMSIVMVWASCDSDISGSRLENQAPDTELSVRDTSLVENLEGNDRLSSTVFVSWSGTDPDGFVSLFEVRYHDRSVSPAPEEGWTQTVRNDSLVLLPIQRGNTDADVVFEVRSIDNDGNKDPSPARTVFPITNSPPIIRFSTFDLPPDTTFTVISFAWNVADPEGPENIASIEVSLNDSTTFTALPPDFSFITLVGDLEENNPGQTEAAAEVFNGFGFQRTAFSVPGLLLDADNTFYIRAVDQTDTTSTTQQFTWFVKKPQGEVLYVNDYRKSTAPNVQAYHTEILSTYLPAGMPINVWDISQPFGTGSTGNTPRSNALPPNGVPSMEQTLALFKYIYWVTTNATNSILGNNLPFAAGVMDLFFNQGGKLLVHTPISIPNNVEDNTGNPAILMLPMNDLVALPDSIGRLELRVNALITPRLPLPGLGVSMPELVSKKFFINELPFNAEAANIVPLMDGAYTYRNTNGQRGDWPEAKSLVSISTDQRVGLFGLPMVNDQTGAPFLEGLNGDTSAPTQAVHLILESLGFPKR